VTRAVGVAGAVLTGGASSRFGSDKTTARLGDRTLVERVVAALASAGVDPVTAVGRSPGAAGGLVPLLADDHPGSGPLGGLVTALGWSPRSHLVVVAGDLPLLDGLTVGALVDRARRCPGSVAVARADGHLQPTCACWPVGLADVVAARFAGGERSIASVLGSLPTEPVDVPGWVTADVDTPADLTRLAEVWSW
jgi:molybdenum cofactor guanylyltransferase